MSFVITTMFVGSQVEDSRTSSSKAFRHQCMSVGDQIFAPVGHSGAVLPIGGSLVLEMIQGNDAQALITAVFSILSSESVRAAVTDTKRFAD